MPNISTSKNFVFKSIKLILLLLFVLLVQPSFSQNYNEAGIIGKIINGTYKTIKIGDSTIAVSDNGNFSFNANIKHAVFYEIDYGNIGWNIYLSPGKKLDMKITCSDPSTIEYSGELASSNEFLKKVDLLNKEITLSLNKNWVKINRLIEFRFISIIDSLKKLYFAPLQSSLKTEKNIGDDFVKLFFDDVNFGLNTLIVQYPENHFNYTGEKISLSQKAIEYIHTDNIDNPEYLNLASYKRFSKAWINYKVDLNTENNPELKCYNLRKMDELFKFVQLQFKNKILNDYWLSEFLSEHIQNNGLANSEKYINEFYSVCGTEIYKRKIEELCYSILDGLKDHLVKTYKSANGFTLQVHLFFPKNEKKGIKIPAIVIFHGGGWVMGDPSWAFSPARHYSDLGMVGIAAQYRLSNRKDITPLDALQDAKDLIIWLRQNVDSLNIDKEKIAASGWSAGGFLAASTAIFADTLQDQQINSVPNAILLTSPAVYMTNYDWFCQLLNGTKVNPLNYSPAEKITKGLPPTIILEGREDTITPLYGVQLFHDKLKENGNYSELWIFDKVGHLFTPTYLGDSGWPQPDKYVQQQADLKSDEFLRKFGFIK